MDTTYSYTVIYKTKNYGTHYGAVGSNANDLITLPCLAHYRMTSVEIRPPSVMTSKFKVHYKFGLGSFQTFR